MRALCRIDEGVLGLVTGRRSGRGCWLSDRQDLEALYLGNMAFECAYTLSCLVELSLSAANLGENDRQLTIKSQTLTVPSSDAEKSNLPAMGDNDGAEEEEDGPASALAAMLLIAVGVAETEQSEDSGDQIFT